MIKVLIAFFISVIGISSTFAGMSKDVTIKGKVYSFDSQSVLIVGSNEYAWRISRSQLKRNLELREGQLLVIQAPASAIHRVPKPKN